MRLFKQHDRPPITHNLELYAGDILTITINFDVTELLFVTEKEVSEVEGEILAMLERVFARGLDNPRIRIRDLYSAGLEKKIDELEWEIAKLTTKRSIWQRLGFGRKHREYE